MRSYHRISSGTGNDQYAQYTEGLSLGTERLAEQIKISMRTIQVLNRNLFAN